MTEALGAGVRRVAVIGDVGGHADELMAELRRLGVDPDGRLPPDLAVVQVGDLVHRGPDSPGVVALVDRYLSEQPDQWIQLAGNHEAQYLAEPAFDWPERIPSVSADTLRRWWATGAMRAAVAVSAGAEDFLITHAGLTAGFWRSIGAPRSAHASAAALNDLIGRDEPTLFRSGAMLRSPRRRPDRVRSDPGPLWAEAGSELVASWAELSLPFSQIHGHTSVVAWATGDIAPEAVRAGRIRIDAEARHATVRLTGGRIIGIDPGHGRHPHPWRSFELRIPVPPTP